MTVQLAIIISFLKIIAISSVNQQWHQKIIIHIIMLNRITTSLLYLTKSILQLITHQIGIHAHHHELAFSTLKESKGCYRASYEYARKKSCNNPVYSVGSICIIIIIANMGKERHLGY